jgi:hypothetical protein
MDPSTLLPMLEVTLDDDGVRAVTIWRQLFRGDAAEALLLVVDDEVMGPVTFTDGDAGPMKIRVVPNSRMGSISPELVGALWRSGPIPLPFTLEESAPPLS